LRIKEQETRQTLQEHNDDNDEMMMTMIRGRGGGTNFILRIKEQETRLTIQEHDDDDDKIFKIAATCFGSQGIHHQGALYSAWLKIKRKILSCPLTWTRSVLWLHILNRCACV
jgi:hypothetical protein